LRSSFHLADLRGEAVELTHFILPTIGVRGMIR
jgi:hypothetical protein